MFLDMEKHDCRDTYIKKVVCKRKFLIPLLQENNGLFLRIFGTILCLIVAILSTINKSTTLAKRAQCQSQF